MNDVLLPAQKEETEKIPLCIVLSMDLETTGLKVFVDEITEIGTASAVLFTDGSFRLLKIKKQKENEDAKGKEDEEQWEDFQKYVKCKRAISNKSQYITGITAAKLKDAPTIKPAMERWAHYVTTICAAYPDSVPRIMIAHNGKDFDIPMMIAELEHCGISAMKFMRPLRFSYFLDTIPLSRDVVDTTLLPRDKNGRACFKLGGIYEAICQRPLVGAHGALADCTAVLELILHHDCFKKAFMADFQQVTKHASKYFMNFMTLVSEIVEKLPKTAPSTTTPSANAPALKKVKTLDQFFTPKKEE